MDQQSLHCKFLGCLQNETGAMRDVGSAWVLNFGSVWTTSTSVFPSRRVKTPCFAEHLQLRSINSIYFNEITAYHLASHHVISYLPSFYMPGLPGWLNWLACVTTSDAGRCFYLSHRSWNWDDQLRLWLADVVFWGKSRSEAHRSSTQLYGEWEDDEGVDLIGLGNVGTFQSLG